MSFNVEQMGFNGKSLTNDETAAKAVASNFERYEDLLLQAYSGKKDLSSVATALGIASDSTEMEIQQVAQTKYEKAMRAFSTFTQLMSQANQMLLNVINKIGK